jgi:fructose/tagatose bisphosphate aldolase
MTGRNIDGLVYELVTSTDPAQKHQLAIEIREFAWSQGIYLASIDAFYKARATGAYKDMTVPAMNIRALTYDLVRAIYRVSKKRNAGAFIMEIARSEMGYTDQSPTEYSAVCLAAAIKEGYKGPVFIQGDHFQVNAKKYAADPKKEIEGLKSLIYDAIAAGFYNIDIDSSTLVDLDKPTIMEQQKLNYDICAHMTALIRKLEPKGITVSVGGEIGEVGKENSTPEELGAFMDGYNAEAARLGIKAGLSKISVQTGTSHGGVVLPDGTVAEVAVDFDVLKRLSHIARDKYGMSGAVQHGASTLPEEAFSKFPEMQTAEVHLATGFQNMIFEHKDLPADLRDEMYAWVNDNCASERKPTHTEAQFIYSARKKALGPFKKRLMDIPGPTRDKIRASLEDKFDFLFDQLGVHDTKELVAKYVKPIEIAVDKTPKKFSEAAEFEGDD